MLQTNLSHITSQEDFQKAIKEQENLMICCGRMGPMCIPVYGVMESLETKYPQVAFRDMEFGNPIPQATQGRNYAI